MRYILAAARLLAGLGEPARAQPVASAPALSLDHVGIQASDLDRSIAFYARVLGLREVPAPFPRDAARWFRSAAAGCYTSSRKARKALRTTTGTISPWPAPISTDDRAP